MKWFKHYGNANTNQFLQAILREKNGLELYGQYWLFLEFLCLDFKKDTEVFTASGKQLMTAMHIGQMAKLRKVLAKFSELSGKFEQSFLKVSETSEKVFKIKTPIILELMGKDFKRQRHCSVTAAAKKKEERRKKKDIVPVVQDTTMDTPQDDSCIFTEVINYLNEKTGKSFKTKSVANRKNISARLNEGFKLDDFKKVIDTKTNDWVHDPNMSKYLRPSTIFGTKFESYLQEFETSPVNAEDEFFDFIRGELAKDLEARGLNDSTI